MIILDATDKSLEVDLAASVTTNQLPIVAAYVDIGSAHQDVSSIASNDTQTNDTTAVTAVAAPSSADAREIKTLSIYNADTVSATVTVQLNNDSTLRGLITQVLETGETLEFTDTDGWKVIKRRYIPQQLAQARENGTSAVSVYSASSKTKIKSVQLCNNSGSPTSFSLYLDNDGTTYNSDTALFVDTALEADQSLQMDVEWPLDAGGNLAYAPGDANAVTITVGGEVQE